jgi:hypothetical protein
MSSEVPSGPKASTTLRVTPEVDGPRPGSVEAQASIALKVMAGIKVFGIVLAMLPGLRPESNLHILAFNGAASALAVILVVEARGLDRLRPWAVAAIRPLLGVLVLANVATVLIALTEGKVRLPIDAAIAGWALFGPADHRPLPRLDRRSLGLVLATLPLLASMQFGSDVFAWGGVLDVDPPDLHASVTASCGPPDGGEPDTIKVTYDWSWSRTSPMPNGLDIVVVGWTGDDAAGRPLYLLERVPESAKGIRGGNRDYPSADMAKAVAAESDGSWNWGIDLGVRGFEPGHFEFLLSRPRPAVSPATLEIRAIYVHLGIWRSDPVTVTCSW